MRGWMVAGGVAVCAMSGCSGAQPPGASDAIDADGDGVAALSGDCDDNNDAIFPGAVDWPGDGVDQDCDGDDDVALSIRGVSEGEVWISEVMRDPLQVSGTLGEWLEVRSAAEVPVDFQDAVLTDGSGDAWTVAQSVVVEPGGTAVFGAWPEPEENGGVEPDAVWGDALGLGNQSDALQLRVDERVLDAVEWTPLWPAEEGYALALDPSAQGATANDVPEAWCLASTTYGEGGFGTPGQDNPPCAGATGTSGVPVDTLQVGDLVITEVMNNPDAVPDEDGEWFELRNLSADRVDLMGLEVWDDDGNRFTVVTSVPVEPGAAVVFGASSDRAVNGDVDVAAEWGATLGLGNGADGLTLMASGVVLDEVHWDEGATFPNAVGVAMSLDPALTSAVDNDLGSSWCEAQGSYGSGDLGSPGTENPACP